MSSRLMTMKFMQRAAASDKSGSVQSKSHGSAETADTESLPAKRRKIDSQLPDSSEIAQQHSLQVQKAIDEEDAKRQIAIDRLAEEAGETKWVLSTIDDEAANVENATAGSSHGTAGLLRIVNSRQFEIESEGWVPTTLGRRSFGRFNRDVERRNVGKTYASSSPLSDSSPEVSDAPDPDSDEGREPSNDLVSAHSPSRLISVSEQEAIKQGKAKRQARRKAEKAVLAQLAEKRKSKAVKLNRLTSISGTGGPKPGNVKSDKECYICGKKGHKKRECPKVQRG